MKSAWLICLLFFVVTTQAQDLNKYERGSFINGKDSIYYRVLFPEKFDPKVQYPILFFLHSVKDLKNPKCLLPPRQNS